MIKDLNLYRDQLQRCRTKLWLADNIKGNDSANVAIKSFKRYQEGYQFTAHITGNLFSIADRSIDIQDIITTLTGVEITGFIARYPE